MKNPIKHRLAATVNSGRLRLMFIFFLIIGFHEVAEAQIAGVTLRSPPISHAFIDESDLLVGGGFSYSKVESPEYRVSNVTPDTIITTETLGFLAYGIFDWIAIGASTNPTSVKLEGTDADSGEDIDTTMRITRSYLYIIPTLYSWKKNRIALIWGKGQANVEENEALAISQESWTIGTTGLVGEFFLADWFSVVPWLSWPYLLFDISPLGVNEIQTPDYGLDGIIYMGDIKLSLTLIFQALDTVDKANEEEEREETKSDDEASQESYAISFSFTF